MPREGGTGGPSLAGVKAAPSSSVKHLGLGRFVLLESLGEGAPVQVVAVAAIGYERVVARVALDHDILKAIESNAEVKVARCSSHGEPSSTYICCEATVLPPDRRKHSEVLLNLSFGFVQRIANRRRWADYAVLELKPKAEPAPSTKAPSEPPPSRSQPPDDRRGAES